MENDVYEIVKAQHDIMQLRFNIRTLEKKKSDAMNELERLLKETGLVNDLNEKEENQNEDQE